MTVVTTHARQHFIYGNIATQLADRKQWDAFAMMFSACVKLYQFNDVIL